MTVREDERDRPARIDWSAWRRLFRRMLVHRRIVVELFIAALLTAATDACFPLVTLGLVDELVERGDEARLLPWGLAYLGLLILLSGCILVFIDRAGSLTARVAHDLRRDGFDRLQELSFSFYDHQPVGWLMARMTSDCDRLSRILAWGLLDISWGVTIMAGVTVLMAVLDWRLTLCVLVAVPALGLVSLRFQRVILASSRRVRKANSRLVAAYNEALMGVRTTKVLAREDENLADFRELSGDMRDASVLNAVQSAAYLPVVLTLGSGATGLALWMGGGLLVKGAVSLGTLLAFLYWSARFYEPLQEIAATFAQLQMAQAAAERVLGLLAEEPEIRDSELVRRKLAENADASLAPGVAPDGGRDRVEEIRFENVDFAYGDGPPVLRGFELTIASGETIALVGATGGGKTTIASLACRFHEPTGGRILLDGVDYRERALLWWQGQLGVVLQQPHLFRGSIRENVRYGRLEASDAEVEEAARAVGLREVVQRLPDGWETDVGAGGDLLSVGEKQLVSFARALLADPQLLVLDEATSSVDVETERCIERGLRAVSRGRTCLIIAHRLSTVRRADRILVVDRGRVVEQGSHAELLQHAGRYRELCLQQNLLPVT